MLKDHSDGKKLDRIKASVKGKKGYRLLITSGDSQETVQASFVATDPKAKVRKTGGNTYMVSLPLGSSAFPDELGKIDNGVLPSSFGNYDVVEPQAFETAGTDYLAGEATDKLWGMQKIGAASFQQALATKDRIKVGILDTGIDYHHPDLAGNYDPDLSYDFVADNSGSTDDNGHGTEVAGIVG